MQAVGDVKNDIYLIQDGLKRKFVQMSALLSRYDINKVIQVNASDLDQYPDGKLIKFSNYSLLSSPKGTVYLLVDETLRGFTSAAVFKALGYSFGSLPKINLSDYPVGPAIASASETHPDGALVLDGKTVWWVSNGTRMGFESEAVFKTYNFSFKNVVKANASDLSLPQGPLVKFRDGTLVNDGGAYYLISDGKKLQFVSVADLTSRGYKTGNAIKASLAAYEPGGSVQ